jgi:SAM-dependent methyltransferase
VAVEPLAAMRAKIDGELEVLEGTAEAIPLPDASVDVVTVGQAFHWFDPEPACAEIARVLRPGGGLGLLWNERDEDVPWVAELDWFIDWPNLRPYAKGTDWAAILDATGRFGPVSHEQLRWEQPVEEDALVDRLLSTSYVATWDVERQAEVDRKVRMLVAGFPALVRLPHVTDLLWCRTTS